MAYPKETTNPTPSNSLLSDSGRIVSRLADIHQRIINLGNTLHGAQPREAFGSAAKPEPEPTLRRNIDHATTWIADIESELDRVAACL